MIPTHCKAFDHIAPVREVREKLAASYHKRAQHEITAGLNLLMQVLSPRLNTLPDTSVTTPEVEAEEWDAFICHASEDKDSAVEPLAKALRARGLRVWYDRWTLNIGDSLRRRIDERALKVTLWNCRS